MQDFASDYAIIQGLKNVVDLDNYFFLLFFSFLPSSSFYYFYIQFSTHLRVQYNARGSEPPPLLYSLAPFGSTLIPHIFHATTQTELIN